MADTRPLYSLHARSLTVLFADVESQALAQQQVFAGTAGSLLERRNAADFPFYAHQFYGADGRKRERYVAGPVGDPAADATAAALRVRIDETKELVPSLRLLGREGFALVDSATFATVASLHNFGLFRAGALLIGSHAYGAILNRMGARAAAYSTEDIDLARGAALALDQRPTDGMLEVLRGSGLDFVEVPSLDRKQPPTSFMQKGRSRLHVDLLVPASNDHYPTIAVPELRAHATGLPFLSYLLAESQSTLLAAREGCCAIRVPLPERFALHKVIVAQLRPGRDAKSRKDLEQAAVLCAILAEHHPGALESARTLVPPRARRLLHAGLTRLGELLRPHPRALEALGLQ